MGARGCKREMGGKEKCFFACSQIEAPTPTAACVAVVKDDGQLACLGEVELLLEILHLHITRTKLFPIVVEPDLSNRNHAHAGQIRAQSQQQISRKLKRLSVRTVIAV